MLSTIANLGWGKAVNLCPRAEWARIVMECLRFDDSKPKQVNLVISTFQYSGPDDQSSTCNPNLKDNRKNLGHSVCRDVGDL